MIEASKKRMRAQSLTSAVASTVGGELASPSTVASGGVVAAGAVAGAPTEASAAVEVASRRVHAALADERAMTTLATTQRSRLTAGVSHTHHLAHTNRAKGKS
jgi:hypothetical protein